jgi:hypothetical protein
MRTTLLSLLSFLSTLGLGLAWLGLLGPGMGDPRAQHIEAALGHEGASLLILGNSVTQSAIDPAVIAEGLGLAEGAVASLASEGAGPGAWLATLERAQAAGWAPRVLLLYVPFDMVWTPLPATDEDVALLVELNASDAAFALAGRPSPGAAVRWIQRREAVQRYLLGMLSAGLVDALWQAPVGARRASERARQAVFAEGGPNDPAGRGARLDGGPARDAASQADPGVARALIATARRHGMRLVVAQPAQHPEVAARPCGQVVENPELEKLLIEGGADVLDLATALPGSQRFKTRHHLLPVGKAELSVILADGLAEMQVLTAPPTQPGRRWTAPCP